MIPDGQRPRLIARDVTASTARNETRRGVSATQRHGGGDSERAVRGVGREMKPDDALSNATPAAEVVGVVVGGGGGGVGVRVCVCVCACVCV